MAQRLVIIGSGMAALRLAERLWELAPDRYAITLIGEEPGLAYNRIQLTPLLAGETDEEALCLHDAAWYRERSIRVLSGAPVTAVCLRTRTLAVADWHLAWDQLVFATGARPQIPAIPGSQLSHVHAFRTRADVAAMLAQPGDAVVLGGGLLGVEAAAALRQRGREVTLVHRQPWLMDAQLDACAGELLERDLQARGIRCVTGSGICQIDSDGVTLTDGERLSAGLVVMATGVHPNQELARRAGVACATGILVDAQLQTSQPQVSALGDCCETEGRCPGLLAPALQQAEILAARLAGTPLTGYRYRETDTRLKVTGIHLFCLGDTRPRPGDQLLTAIDPRTDHYRRLLLRDGRLRGALLYGDLSPAARLSEHLEHGTPAGTALLFDHTAPRDDAAGSEAMTELTTKQTLVVVGHGMVGHHFLEQAVQLELHLRYHIVVFGDERQAAYDRVHLSEYFAGRSAESLSLVEAGFFERHGIELRTGCAISEIDRERRVVRDAEGHEVRWDKLILATGSRAFVPPIPGQNLPGCLAYRTLEDLAAIRERAASARRGVVIGGGLLGLEAANALRQLGLETHVVEFSPRLMAVQLDEVGAGLLRDKITALGVSVHTSKNTTRIDEEQGRLRLSFADGEQLQTDLLLFSAGIRPRDELARDCGLTLGERGGVAIDDACRTDDPDILAIGECALWQGQIFGLVAPGYQMARVAAAGLAGEAAVFNGADMSTKLKLLGVEVASFGDAHGRTAGSQSYQWRDGPGGIYKKIVTSADNSRLLGGVLVGDSGDYATLTQMMLNDMALPSRPESLILPLAEGGARKGVGVAALPESAQICSCHNVSKGDICAAVDADAQDMAALKAATKAATGCGGCAGLAKQVLECQLAARGVEVKKDICEHFPWSRQEIYHLVRVNHIRTFDQLISRYGHGYGCEICKPLVASVLASCWNDYLLQPAHLPLQDTNDRYFANIQKDGSYSVVPRVAGGEITPDGLIAIGEVAKRYGLYSKITGGQRIDLFGARLEQLPDIWRDLLAAGFETGHAYGKSLRTVKSCVGSSWCRYGVQDSTGLAIELEHRYKGLRSPHKIKMAVSGCTRECAEAQSKDVGVIATDKGWNLYVCGNGGMKPRHADLFASDLDTASLIRTIDRLLMFYIRTADRLQRTSVWMDNLEGGIDYLRAVILEDSLGIGDELDREMAHVIASYQCEWQTTLNSPERLALFRSFVNDDTPDERLQSRMLRGQRQPVAQITVADARLPSRPWQAICALESIPENAGIGARLGEQQIALFRFGEQVFALDNLEPANGAGVLSRGILGDRNGEPMVISPLYKQQIRLRDGCNLEDGAPAVRAWPVKVEAGQVWVASQALIVRARAS
jgi:nitrite reductase (NADH) large subunit